MTQKKMKKQTFSKKYGSLWELRELKNLMAFSELNKPDRSKTKKPE